VAAAREANGPGGSHHLAHRQVVHPDDIPRFAQVGATANIQTLWAAHEDQMDELTIPFLGERRASWQNPFGALLRSGAQLCSGSDWPVSSADPLDAILAVALSSYTAGTARVNGHADSTGRLEPGMFADLAVLDRDPFAGPPSAIADATVVATFVEGERVFTRETS
jgi:predicted amidohydrolase YtcJ